MDLRWEQRPPNGIRCINKETGQIVATVVVMLNDVAEVHCYGASGPIAAFQTAPQAQTWVRENASSLLKTFKV